MLARDPLGRVPVVRPERAGGPVARRRRHRRRHALRRAARPARRRRARRAAAGGLDVATRSASSVWTTSSPHVQAVAAGYRGVYLVGGAVRDLLLERARRPTSTSPSRATASSSRASWRRGSGPRARPPQVPDGGDRGRRADGERSPLRVDVASTRTEFYDFPAALPKVEHATIRGDLARRDFSINAMAVSLNPRDFGGAARLLRRPRRPARAGASWCSTT